MFCGDATLGVSVTLVQVPASALSASAVGATGSEALSVGPLVPLHAAAVRLERAMRVRVRMGFLGSRLSPEGWSAPLHALVAASRRASHGGQLHYSTAIVGRPID